MTPGPARRPTTAEAERGTQAALSRGYAWYALGLLTFINFFNYADRNVVFAVFEPIKHALDLSDQQLGWIGSAYIIVLSIAALPLGVIGDLKTRRGVITFGVGVWSFFTAMGGLVQSFGQLFFCRAMVGIGEAGYAPVSQALIAEYFPGKRRAFAIGTYSVGMAVGGLAGVWLGGIVAETLGWRAAFVVMGVPGLILTVLASQLREPRRRPPTPLRASLERFVKRGIWRILWYGRPLLLFGAAGALLSAWLATMSGVPSELDTMVFAVFVGAGVAWTFGRLAPLALRHRSEASAVAHNAAGEFAEAATAILRVPTLTWMFLGGALVTFAVNGLIAWAPSFMQRVHHFSVSDVGREFGIWALSGGVLGALVGGRLGDWLFDRFPGGRVIVSGAGFILGAPVCASLLLVGGLRWFVPLVFVTYFFYTWYNGPISAVLFDVVPAAVRASVMGGFVLFSHLAGDAIAPPLIGYLSDQFGLQRAMLLLPAAGLLGGVVILIALRTVGRDMRRVSEGAAA